jgi:prevent-host-death family protein
MRVWQLQEAKAQFSELVKLTKHEPQVVSIRGKDEVILLSIAEYNSLTAKKPSFLEFMELSPLKGMNLKLARDKSKARDIRL